MPEKGNRRRFLASALAGGAGVSLSGCSGPPVTAAPAGKPPIPITPSSSNPEAAGARRELFASPVIIETLELLRFDNNFLCRVRSKDGAEGISAANNSPQLSL